MNNYEVMQVPNKQNRLVDRSELLSRTKLCRTTLWKMIRDGRFPPPRNTGLRHARWLESDIANYFNSLEQKAIK